MSNPLKSLKQNKSDFLENINHEDKENRVNDANYKDIDRKIKEAKRFEYPPTIWQNYVNDKQWNTRNSFIWNSNKGSSYGSTNEKQTSEFGKKNSIQPPPNIRVRNFNENNHSSDIPEFTLGPMKFSSWKVKPVKATNQNKFNTLNPDDIGNESKDSQKLRKNFYTIEQESPSFSKVFAAKKINREESLEAIEINKQDDIEDTPNFK